MTLTDYTVTINALGEDGLPLFDPPLAFDLKAEDADHAARRARPFARMYFLRTFDLFIYDRDLIVEVEEVAA